MLNQEEVSRPPSAPSAALGTRWRGFAEEARLHLRLAVPIALAQFGMIALSLVDTAFVGRVSTVDLAAVALGRSIVFALSSLCLGAASAIEPLAAQALGAGLSGRAWEALRHAARAVFLLSVPAVAATVACTWLLPTVRVSQAVTDRTRLFLVAQMPNQVLLMLFFAGKSFLQAHGVTRPALAGAAVANVVNLVLCATLVRGDDSLRALGLPPIGLAPLGALGAALASDAASLVLAGMVFAAARPLGGAAPRAVSAPPQGGAPVTTATVLRLGLPIGLQFAAEIGVFSLAAVLAGRLGDVSLSAHQIALSLASFTFMGSLGVSGATAVRVGHAVGGGLSPRRPGFVGIALGLAAMTPGALAFALSPEILVRFFTNDDAVIAVAVPLVRVAAGFQVFDGIQVVAAGALRGAGDVRVPFVASVVSYWAVGFPIAVLLGFWAGMGALGLWLGLTVGLVTVAAAQTARFAWLSASKVRAL